MRDLQKINSHAVSTRRLLFLSLIISVIMGLCVWALAYGVKSNFSGGRNPLENLGIGIVVVSIAAFPASLIFKWTWEAKYFGAGLIPFFNTVLLGICPILCIFVYGSLRAEACFVIFLIQFLLIFKWCNRFVEIYKVIYANSHLFYYIYQVNEDAVYFCQRADQEVLLNFFNFRQFPGVMHFFIPFGIAFFLIPFSREISEYVGVPFVHIFLAIVSHPLNLSFLGICTKAWLVYYFYPYQIKGRINLPIYVDMTSIPEKKILNSMQKNIDAGRL